MGAINSGYGTQQGQNPGTGGGSGPPFALNSAYNGASVDTATFQIVLGNDRGLGAAGPAALVSDREIFMDAFVLVLVQDADIHAFVKPDLLQMEDSSTGDFMQLLRNQVSFKAGPTLSSLSNVALSIQDLAASLELIASSLELHLTDSANGYENRATADTVLLTNPAISTSSARVNFTSFTVDNGAGLNAQIVASGLGVQDVPGNTTAINAGIWNLNNPASTLKSAFTPSQIVLQDVTAGNTFTIVAAGLDIADGASTFDANANLLQIKSGVNQTQIQGGRINIVTLGTFASNALALAGGLVVGDLYKNAAGVVSIVF